MKKKIVTVLTTLTLCISLSACTANTDSQEVNGTQNNTTAQQPRNLKPIRNNEQVDLLNSDEFASIRLAIEVELKNAVIENGGTNAIITNMIGYINMDDAFVKGWVTVVEDGGSSSVYFEVEVYLDENDNVTDMNWLKME